MTGKWGFVVVPAVLVIVLDQLTKGMVLAHMQLHQSISVVDGFFALTYVRNTGAAFGILAGRQYQYTMGRDAGFQQPRPQNFYGPMVVMQNERSASDAEMFPAGFKALGLGKVVYDYLQPASAKREPALKPAPAGVS